MNKKLIQQLLDDDETRAALADELLLRFPDEWNNHHYYIREALDKLNDTLVEDDMVTIEVSEYMWVRGEYVRTEPDGKLEVAIQRPPGIYTGKRVDLVVKDHEGETT